MKKLFALILASGLVFSISTQAADSFIEGMEDIPIPDKMIQIQSDNISFGNVETRFVEAYLQTNFGKFSFVKGFYTDTLPQLGWQLEDQDAEYLTFVRGGEELQIVLVSKMPLIVRVTLTGQH